ncbi:hypothetical protein DVH24_032042 [Malus domestica]|uniref:Solute carrier family 25 member 44 n=1 Tax=Malus domestica TaxID=3750 RepID=A0A498J4R0_MALDO|nr:hypothetical protein DVH24_032042 [Malus domestica]
MAVSIGNTEINWDKLDKTKFYVVGAGLFTGVTVALYPVSVVKTRLQVASKDALERDALSVAKGIWKADGIPGLYRGFGTVITGAVPARIIFLSALEATKVAAFKMVQPLKLSEATEAAFANGVAGMTASLFAQSVFVPIDVISQRLMVQGYSGHAKYTGGLDVARKVIKSDGIRGLYRGLGLSVMTYSPSSAVWWASYGSSQRLIWSFLGHGIGSEEAVPSVGNIVLVQAAGGIIAGATASCVTTPLDTIKTRLQTMGHDKRPTAREVIKNLIRDDGWQGFYRGLVRTLNPLCFFVIYFGSSSLDVSVASCLPNFKSACVQKMNRCHSSSIQNLFFLPWSNYATTENLVMKQTESVYPKKTLQRKDTFPIKQRKLKEFQLRIQPSKNNVEWIMSRVLPKKGSLGPIFLLGDYLIKRSP